MASVNKAILLGNLGCDPEVRAMNNGMKVANLSLATNRRYRSRDNQTVTETEWHRVVVYDRLAEIVEKYTKKGDPIYIEGRLHSRKWTDRQGVERSTVEIVADTIQLLGAADRDQRQQSAAPARSEPQRRDDECPF